MIENTNAPTGMETQQLRGVSTGSKVLGQIEAQARPTKPTFKIDDNKWTYATNMIEYEALMELYLYYTQLKKKRTAVLTLHAIEKKMNMASQCLPL